MSVALPGSLRLVGSDGIGEDLDVTLDDPAVHTH